MCCISANLIWNPRWPTLRNARPSLTCFSLYPWTFSLQEQRSHDWELTSGEAVLTSFWPQCWARLSAQLEWQWLSSYWFSPEGTEKSRHESYSRDDQQLCSISRYYTSEMAYEEAVWLHWWALLWGPKSSGTARSRCNRSWITAAREPGGEVGAEGQRACPVCAGICCGPYKRGSVSSFPSWLGQRMCLSSKPQLISSVFMHWRAPGWPRLFLTLYSVPH